jgi:hypothetical protein
MDIGSIDFSQLPKKSSNRKQGNQLTEGCAGWVPKKPRRHPDFLASADKQALALTFYPNVVC